jgi:hypothetical protein
VILLEKYVSSPLFGFLGDHMRKCILSLVLLPLFGCQAFNEWQRDAAPSSVSAIDLQNGYRPGMSPLYLEKNTRPQPPVLTVDPDVIAK